MSRNTVVIGGTKSDSHVVSIYLAELFMKERGYQVINRSCQNTVSELMNVDGLEDSLLAIVVVNQNGHALDDLEGLERHKALLPPSVPIILGGHYWLGCERSETYIESLRKCGVDYMLDCIEDLEGVLAKVTEKFAAESRESNRHPRAALSSRAGLRVPAEAGGSD
jgi:methylmalonyl-CoA mutase cobalamin-binding subunit